ncbi:MAG: FAD-binding protein [Chthoniobacterales bacterium]
MKYAKSWGLYPNIRATQRDCWWLKDIIGEKGPKKYLAIGLGRSYGDVGLLSASQGCLLGMQRCNHLSNFDAKSGTLTAEAGCSIETILNWSVPRGWFLPVVPGTRHVTLGGAIANDIHGKNHHRDGTFGHWVESFTLFHSEKGWLDVAKGSDLFAATIGGLGLTGIIGQVRLRLQKIPAGGWIEQQTECFSDLKEGCEFLNAMDGEFPMSVAWLNLDSKRLGGGVAMGGRFVEIAAGEKEARLARAKLAVPISAPNFLLNKWSIGCFNKLYSATRRTGLSRVDFGSYFFPLDSVLDWNRLYGAQGFLQYQCVVPSEETLAELIKIIRNSEARSFLSVLKKFGSKESLGWLSFPKAGWTLAMDFPMRGEKTLSLMNRLDEVVQADGGRLYPAKDARMSEVFFKKSYPKWSQLEESRDPQITSAFWSRMTES